MINRKESTNSSPIVISSFVRGHPTASLGSEVMTVGQDWAKPCACVSNHVVKRAWWDILQRHLWEEERIHSYTPLKYEWILYKLKFFFSFLLM